MRGAKASHGTMQKLRGSGTTFSTSGKRWVPWTPNHKIAARNARLHRLKREGILQPLTKAEARKLCDAAVATHPTSEIRNR